MRSVDHFIRKIQGQFPVLVITGARQVGKTTLVRHLFPHHRYVTFDHPDLLMDAKASPSDFFRKYPPPVILDEIQYAPELFRHIKILVDRDRREKGRFILTGSQNFLLMGGIGESLAGRAAICELETFDLQEVRSFEKNKPITETLLDGGFPEINAATPKPDRFVFYQSYLRTHIERDVRNILNVSDIMNFERFIRACAMRSAQTLSKSDLARDVGISPSTAAQWLSVLRSAGQITLIEPFHSNLTKSIAKSPKLYMNEVGMLVHLLGITSAEALESSRYLGHIWETFVCAELRKMQINVRGTHQIRYWTDRKREVDFVIEENEIVRFIDAKWAASEDRRNFDQILRAAETIKASPRQERKPTWRGYLITHHGRSFKVDQNLEVLGLSASEPLLSRLER